MKNKCRKICAVSIIVIPIVWFLCGVCNRTIFLSPDDTLCLTHCQADTSVAVQSERVSELTLVVNGINNILTSTNNIMTLWALVVSILTLLLAALGLIGYHELKKEFKEQKENHQKELNDLRQQSDKKIAEYSNKVDDCLKTAEEIKNNHDQIKKTQSLSNIYMQSVNQWMYENAYNIAQVSDSAKDIMNKAFLKYNIMKLYLCDETREIDECIEVIKQKGGEDEIKALQSIVDKDMNQYKKAKASEAIGYIRARLRTQEGESQNT